MAGLQAFTLDSGRLASAQPYEVKLFFTVTGGAVTQLLTRDLPPVIVGVTDGAFTQAAVNKLLEVDSTGADLSAVSTAEVNVPVAFGATAMGTDALGFVVYCAGQIERVAGAKALLLQASEDSKWIPVATSLPDTLSAGLLVTPAGNLAGRVILTGLDSATGVVELSLYVFSK